MGRVRRSYRRSVSIWDCKCVTYVWEGGNPWLHQAFKLDRSPSPCHWSSVPAPRNIVSSAIGNSTARDSCISFDNFFFAIYSYIRIMCYMYMITFYVRPTPTFLETNDLEIVWGHSCSGDKERCSANPHVLWWCDATAYRLLL